MAPCLIRLFDATLCGAGDRGCRSVPGALVLLLMVQLSRPSAGYRVDRLMAELRAQGLGFSSRCSCKRAQRGRAAFIAKETLEDFSMSNTRKSSSGKYELVLGGGGIKGYGHIGVLKAIREHDIKIGMVTGVSIGSAVAALYRNGYSPDEALDILLKEFTAFNRRVIGRGKKPTSFATVLSLLSGIELYPFFQDVLTRYNVTPRRNLRIVAFDAIQMKPVVFEGLKYDLATAVAASCSIPFVMRPVWTGDWKKGRTGRTIVERVQGKTDQTILVDGGVYHPAPGNFCKGKAIISRLGIASEMPREKYDECGTWAEYVFQSIEVAAGRFIERYFPFDETHVVVRSGKPDVGTLTFGICREQALGMVDYAYGEANNVFRREGLGKPPKSK